MGSLMKLNKVFCIIIFVSAGINLFSQTLPKPKDGKLYTEFTFVRKSKYLKKPIIGSGYIAMDGTEKFIMKQSTPVLIVVRKNNKKMTIKKENNEPIEVDPKASGDIMFLFENDEVINARFNITKQTIEGMDKFMITPKTKEQIKSINVISTFDKVNTIEITFNDDSNLIYTFKNTLTGITPDEKYFK